jgi:hypothetical protein
MSMPSTKQGISPQLLNRPFYFIVVLWGERFRNYLLDFCLPSLLSPRNLPSISTRPRSQLLIFTRPEDWEIIQASPIFKAISQYVDPEYRELPPCPPELSGCQHMGASHKYAFDMAYKNKAYPFVMMPDSIFSDGTIARLQELALEGNELVFVPALRFAEEPLFEQFEKRGISTHGRGGIAEPISLSGRELAAIALPSMHSETKAYEWDSAYLTPSPAAVWWRVPDEDGIVVHCLSWALFLIDFNAVPKHDTSTFDGWTLDGDYAYKNLGNIKKIYFVLDSDEMFIASWAPLEEKAVPLHPDPHLAKKWTGKLTRMIRLNQWFYGGGFDPLKQEHFFTPVRWHARDIIKYKWRPVERKALRILTSALGPAPASIAELHSKKFNEPHSLNRNPLGLPNALSTWERTAQKTLLVLFRAKARIFYLSTQTALQISYRSTQAAARITYRRSRFQYYVAHYSAQGPAHVKYYYYHASFFIRHHFAQGHARWRAIISQGPARLRYIFFRAISYVTTRLFRA